MYLYVGRLGRYVGRCVCVYIYICIHVCYPPLPCAYSFLSLQGDNTALLQETDFLGEEEKRQTLSNFQDLTFPISSFPTFLDLTFQLPNFPTFQLSNIPTFQLFGPNFPTFQHYNFLGLTLKWWKVGKSGPKSWKVGMLESWNVGKLGGWNIGMLEKLESWQGESWKVGKLESWKVRSNKVGKLETEAQKHWTKTGKSAPKT